MAKKEQGYMGFVKLKENLQDKGHDVDSAKAIAAWIGRKKYGTEAFAKIANKGRKGG